MKDFIAFFILQRLTRLEPGLMGFTRLTGFSFIFLYIDPQIIDVEELILKIQKSL